MRARYLTDEKGKRIGVVLDIEEYERLREIEDEMEDLEALQGTRNQGGYRAERGRGHPLETGHARDSRGQGHRRLAWPLR
jgi:hypothetical protein